LAGSLISGATTVYYLFSALLVRVRQEAIRRLRACARSLCSASPPSPVDRPARIGKDALAAVRRLLIMSFGWPTMSVGAITNILGLWFERRRGLAISLALTGAKQWRHRRHSGVWAFLIGERGLATAMMIASCVMMAILLPPRLLWIREPMPDPNASTGADINALGHADPAPALDTGDGVAQLQVRTITGRSPLRS